MKENLKCRILNEMQEVLDASQLKLLKECLDRQFYGYTITKEETDLVAVSQIQSNEEMLRIFGAMLLVEQKSRKTIQQYIRETQKFLLAVNKHWSEVTNEDIIHYLWSQLKKGNSSASVDNSRKFISQFFRWLFENEHIRKNPFVRVKPIKRKEPEKEVITESEIVLLRDNCENQKELAIIDFLYSTGVRVSEFVKCKISDVNFKEKSVRIYSNKTNSWRMVYLDPNAYKHLVDYLQTRKDRVDILFPSRNRVKGCVVNMSNDGAEKYLQRIWKRAGLTKKCTIHLFRRSLATRLYLKGMRLQEISKIMGHATIATTQKYYTILMERDIHDSFNKLSA